MAAWNIWKASFLQSSPDPLEPSTPQREASSIYWLFQDQTYRKTSSISRTKSQSLNVFRILAQLSSLNPLNPGVKLRMKM